MMCIRSFVFMAIVMLVACGSKKDDAPTLPTAPAGTVGIPVEPGTADVFSEAWPDLMAILSGEERDSLIDPKIGLWVIDNPGAYIVLRKVTKLNELEYHDLTVIGCEPRTAEKLPTFSCDTETWSDTGCLHVSDPKVPLARIHRDTILYAEARELNGQDQEDLELLLEVEKFVTYAVFYKDITYFFGVVRGAWRLIAVNIVTPCSA